MADAEHEDRFLVLVNGGGYCRVKGKEHEVLKELKSSISKLYGDGTYLHVFRLTGPGVHNSVCVFADKVSKEDS